MPPSTADTKPANKLGVRGRRSSHSPAGHCGHQLPPTDAQCSLPPHAAAGRGPPLLTRLEPLGIQGTTALPSSAFASPDLPTN